MEQNKGVRSVWDSSSSGYKQKKWGRTKQCRYFHTPWGVTKIFQIKSQTSPSAQQTVSYCYSLQRTWKTHRHCTCHPHNTLHIQIHSHTLCLRLMQSAEITLHLRNPNRSGCRNKKVEQLHFGGSRYSINDIFICRIG